MNENQDHATMDHLKNVVHVRNSLITNNMQCQLKVDIIPLFYLLAGLWSLSYEQELTTPLHITAGRGFVECLRLLLQRGANVDLAPEGTTALHEACENCQPECTNLLLIHGANANVVSEGGFMPLHFCMHPESLE